MAKKLKGRGAGDVLDHFEFRGSRAPGLFLLILAAAIAAGVPMYEVEGRRYWAVAQAAITAIVAGVGVGCLRADARNYRREIDRERGHRGPRRRPVR